MCVIRRDNEYRLHHSRTILTGPFDHVQAVAPLGGASRRRCRSAQSGGVQQHVHRADKENLHSPHVLCHLTLHSNLHPNTYVTSSIHKTARCLQATRSKLSLPTKLPPHARDSTARPSLQAILFSAPGRPQLIRRLLAS